MCIRDRSTVDSTMEMYLGEIEFNVDYKRWAFGHFHADRLYPWADGRQMLMLFNENVVNLDKFMNMTEKMCIRDRNDSVIASGYTGVQT